MDKTCNLPYHLENMLFNSGCQYFIYISGIKMSLLNLIKLYLDTISADLTYRAIFSHPHNSLSVSYVLSIGS